MNVLVNVILALVCLVIALLIIALFAPKGYLIEKEITIHRSIQEVFSYIRYLKNQDYFNKWVMMDPAMQKKFSGVDGKPGFIYAWSGNKKAGAGEQEITKITEGTSIDIEIRFMKPFKGLAHATMEAGTICHSEDGHQGTKLRWVFSSRLKYPMNIFLLFMNVDKTLGRDIETSLRKLKQILEGVPETKTPDNFRITEPAGQFI